MRLIFRSLLYLAAFVVPIVLTGGAGLMTSLRTTDSRPPAELAARIIPPPAPRYDATKPTVVVALGDQVNEITDTLGPYATFAESGLYNVYTVASSKTPHTVTGGLDLVPHLSFAELDVLLGRSPDIVVVPSMTGVGAAENRPLLDWLRRQAQGDALLFSWCTGANVLAAAGVLDGKPATAHWGDIDRLERLYPAVQWQRGVRYIDAGTVLTTGGLTSGFDATLYLLAKRHGPEVAKRVAEALHYDLSFDFVAAPPVEQYQFSRGDSIYLFNLAFNLTKRSMGVWLYDGVGDLELASVFDTYAASWTTRTQTVADTRRIVTTRYGLQLVPRWDVDTLPPVNRLLVSGGTSGVETEASLAAVEGRIAAPITRLHDTPGREFAFEAPLEDLGRTENVPTAAFAAKRLEFRAPLRLVGPGWPVFLLLQPVLIGGAGVGLPWWITRRGDRRRQQRRIQQAPVSSMATA